MSSFNREDMEGYFSEFVFLVFFVAQLLKNTRAMWETWVRSLGLEDSLEKGV